MKKAEQMANERRKPSETLELQINKVKMFRNTRKGRRHDSQKPFQITLNVRNQIYTLT